MTGVNAAFDGSTASQLAGSVAGAGGLAKNGSGTLTLSGANSYAGGHHGQWRCAGPRGSTSSLQGAIVNNATVEVDQTINGSYAGNMSGSGTLMKSGAGTLTLSVEFLLGGTTVTGGTLSGTSSNLQGTIANNAVVEFNQSIAGSYSGAMSGSGQLAKSGSGTLTLGSQLIFGRHDRQ